MGMFQGPVNKMTVTMKLGAMGQIGCVWSSRSQTHRVVFFLAKLQSKPASKKIQAMEAGDSLQKLGPKKWGWLI
jgi:hypothetical protein